MPCRVRTDATWHIKWQPDVAITLPHERRNRSGLFLILSIYPILTWMCAHFIQWYQFVSILLLISSSFDFRITTSCETFIQLDKYFRHDRLNQCVLMRHRVWFYDTRYQRFVLSQNSFWLSTCWINPLNLPNMNNVCYDMISHDIPLLSADALYRGKVLFINNRMLLTIDNYRYFATFSKPCATHI